MNLKEYLKDKTIQIIITTLGLIIILLTLNAFKINQNLKIFITIIYIAIPITNLLYDYLRKYKYYQKLKKNLNDLDQKYLILEMLNKPNFYEGKIFYETLYEANKSMIENIKKYKLNIKDFKEYIEMWIHEVKIPIATLTLINHNTKNKNPKYTKQIKKLDNYIDQILYYVRSENAEKDYLIKEQNLNEIIKNIALKNKDDLLENHINLDVNLTTKTVLTDSKWLEFILNQIINNSIKYKKENPYIKITTKEDKDKIYLIIYDNGIGIKESDLPRVFEKSFTGENGRTKAKSTGMGLYIAKKLSQKLGHQIKIESEKNKYTTITIIFSKNDFYKISK